MINMPDKIVLANIMTLDLEFERALNYPMRVMTVIMIITY